ncbi:MAG TPA: IclR family transcriptional regulator C-terminal domain-containing protein [Amycolatopsis sp.]|nr:IclR family transcriptional regulator C-terminal domain-containing protein [Amycolatopsis sp.]
MSSSPPGKEDFVIALARGLEVIQAFDADHPEMTLSEVAEATGLSPAVARRFLRTLVHLGFAAHEKKRFMLRPRILELGAAYLASMNLTEVAQPHLQQLRDTTGDSASLTVLDGPDIIHISHVSTQRLMRFFVTSGTRIPAYVSSTGRVLLAHLTPAALDEYFATAELTRRTEHTVLTEADLRTELATIRETGHAVVVDELDYGMTSIGVPVFDARGVVVAGVGCLAPTGYAAAVDLAAERLPALREAAAEITRELRRFPFLAKSITNN